jgi:hypothetical protein
MLYRETQDGFAPWNPADPIGGVRYPPNIGQLWSAAELAALGLYTPAPADPTPEGKIVTGTAVARVGVVVKFVNTLADAPIPTPADTPLTMRQLRLGLLLIGGFPATFIQDAITAIPDATQRGVAQIWYDESATVEWEHPMTQQLIAAAGITTKQAAAMWMQAKDLEV